MLILDGTDNVGKTTLCNKLAVLANEMKPFNEVKFKVNHMTRPDEDFNFFTDYKTLMGQYIIQDRFHFGAIAYHNLCPYNQDQLKFIESWLYRLGSMIIIVHPTSQFYYKTRLNVSRRKEMFDVETIIRAYHRYDDIVLECLESGMRTSFDEVIYVDLNVDGDIVSTADEPHLKAILEVWFDRIRIANELFEWGRKQGVNM